MGQITNPSGAATLTNTFVGVGDAGGMLSGSIDLTYAAGVLKLSDAEDSILIGGAAPSATSTGRTMTLQAGPGGSTSGSGGTATITGGVPTAGAGGGVVILGANGVGTNQNGGSIQIQGGAATGSGTAGSVLIVTNGNARITFSAAGGFLLGGTAGSAGQQITSNGASAAPTWQAASSDARMKTNVIDLALGVDFVNKLRPVEYSWIKDRDDGKRHYGLIAQDLLTLDPAMGMVCSQITYIDKAPVSTYGVQYNELVPVLVSAIKELAARVQILEAAA